MIAVINGKCIVIFSFTDYSIAFLDLINVLLDTQKHIRIYNISKEILACFWRPFKKMEYFEYEALSTCVFG